MLGHRERQIERPEKKEAKENYDFFCSFLVTWHESNEVGGGGERKSCKKIRVVNKQHYDEFSRHFLLSRTIKRGESWRRKWFKAYRFVCSWKRKLLQWQYGFRESLNKTKLSNGALAKSLRGFISYRRPIISPLPRQLRPNHHSSQFFSIQASC